MSDDDRALVIALRRDVETLRANAERLRAQRDAAEASAHLANRICAQFAAANVRVRAAADDLGQDVAEAIYEALDNDTPAVVDLGTVLQSPLAAAADSEAHHDHDEGDGGDDPEQVPDPEATGQEEHHDE